MSHLKSIVAVAFIGLTNIKRALVAGNYYNNQGIGFGGYKRAQSVEHLISYTTKKKFYNSDRIILLDHHTGLGPSGTDTLALLGQSDSNSNSNSKEVNEWFINMIDKTFPLERDGDGSGSGSGEIVGGDKASDKDGSAMR